MLFVKDYTCVVLIGNPCSQGKKSKYLIETHYLTELLTLYRVRDFWNPAKIQGRTQKYHVPVPPKCQALRVKQIIIPRYLNSGMGSINIPTDDFSRHKVRINTDNF